MDKVVLDTSVIVKWFSSEKGRKQALKILNQVVKGKIKLVEPELVFYELINACWFGKQFSGRKIKRIINEFFNLEPEIKILKSKLISEIMVLIKKFPLTSYDAVFIAIANLRKIPLITADSKHHQKSYSKFVVPLDEIEIS